MKRFSRVISITIIFLIALGTFAGAAKAKPVLVPLQSMSEPQKDEKVNVRWTKDLEQPVWSLAVSTDGRYEAVGLNDGHVLIFDITTGQEVRDIEAHRKRVYAIAFSRDNRLMATSGHDEKVYIWDTSTWQQTGELEEVEQIMYSLGFSPDGRTLATGSRAREVILWDVGTRTRKTEFEGHGHLVSALAYSPDGGLLATGSYDRKVIVWDASSGEQKFTLEHRYPVYSLAFSPDGKLLATGTKGREIFIWNMTTGAEFQTLEGHTSIIYSLAFSPDGRTLASGSHDRSVRLWDYRKGEESMAFTFQKKSRDSDEKPGHRSAVQGVAFSSDGRSLASGGLDRKLFVWQTSGTKSNSNAFKKGEFETTEEYKERLKSYYIHYTVPATLGRYNADRGGYNITFGEHKAFVKVPRDVARQMKNRAGGVHVEGLLGFHDAENAELVNAELVDDVLGIRYQFGRQVKDAVASVSTPGMAAPKKAGAPRLSFTAKLTDEDDDKVLEGGESVSLVVTVENKGKGSALGVKIELEGDDTLLGFLGRGKVIGHLPPNSEQDVAFEAVLPTELKAGNSSIKIFVKESRGYSATEVKILTVAMQPASFTETSKVLSRLNDVDIVPQRVRGHRCDDCLAVVVGISKYRNSNAVPDVKYARKDAEYVSKYLETVGGVPPANIKLLVDESATRADIASTIEEWLPRRVNRKSTVFVYYAGHGTPDPATSQAYIVPYEGEPGYLKKLYGLDQMYKSLNRLEAQQVVVMLDSCFSGSGERSVIPKGARPMALSVENPVLAGKKVAVLAASKGDQISSDYERAGHGLFTYYLLKGLKGDADADGNGRVALDELYGYVSQQVADTAARELDRDQNPVLLPGLDGLKGRDITVTRVK